jgi:hypothetical protein
MESRSMVEKAGNSDSKSWWENQLDWSLPDSLEDTLKIGGQLIKNIPATLAAYRLGKTSPVDRLESEPVEKISTNNLKPKIVAASSESSQKAEVGKTRPAPRVLPPPPKPASLIKREQERLKTQSVRAVNMPTSLEMQSGFGGIAPPGAPLAQVETASSSNQISIMTEEEHDELVHKVNEIVESKGLTLEQLLDPEFCEYTS